LEIFGQYYLTDPFEPGIDVSPGVQITGGGLAIPAAVKRAPDESDHQVELLKNEAVNGVLFEHDRVVRILDFGAVEGRTYLATQLLLGRSLKGVMRQVATAEDRPDPTAWIAIAMGLLEGLENIHNCGFVHRDVSPDNIFVGFDGRTLLGGCGQAIALGEERPQPQNRYASPEQMAGAEVDHRADIYSVGLCLRDLLRLSFAQPGLMHGIERVIEQAVASRPESRFPTAMTFKDELARLIDSRDPGSRIISTMSQLFPRQADKEWSRIEELARDALDDAPLAREISVRVVPVDHGATEDPAAIELEPPPPQELPPLESFSELEQERHSPWAKRLSLLIAAAVLLPLIAYASSSRENMQSAGRYLRYAVLGQKPGGTLTVESVPSGARLFLDGVDTGKKTPISIASLESEVVHELRLELPGEEPETSTVAIAAAERRTVTVLIESAMVDLFLKSEPERADVTINGRPVAFTPCSAPVRVGQPAAIRVSKVGYQDFERTVVPERGKPIDLAIVLEKTAELLAAEAEEAEIRAEMEAETKQVKRAKKPRGKRGKKVSSRRSRRTDS
jgi:serine/threonine protein kinase